MTNLRLDQEEQELLDAFESGEFGSDLSEERRAALAQTARAASKWDQEIDVPLSSRDLEALQRRAIEAGLSTQALASSVLHRYLSGTLKEVLMDKAHYLTDS